MSTSVAFERNVSVSDIIAAVGWRSTSTFAKFYLREMGSARDALNTVGQIAVPAMSFHTGERGSDPVRPDLPRT